MRDASALPLLLDVMDAAGRHDQAKCVEMLNEVRALLIDCGTTKPLDDIDAAHESAEAQDWGRVWSFAWSATTGLTWAFPPDPSMCPPRPGPEPLGDQRLVCAGCAESLPAHAKFCSACGQALV